MLVVIIDRARILKTRKIEACLQFAASIVIANRTFVHFSSLEREREREREREDIGESEALGKFT
jgi:hypothetical protein